MTCGQRSKTLLLLSALLLLLSWPSFSDGADQGGTYRDLLIECVTRLETTTNELEKSIELNEAWSRWSATQTELLDNALIWNRELIAARKADAIQFREIETSFNEYVSTTRRVMIRNTAIAFGVGIPTGVVLYEGIRWLLR